MSHPLVGDPASMSALGATLRRTAVQLRADGERLEQLLADATPGWTGPTAHRTRRRVASLAASSTAVAASLDSCGHALHLAATELASSIGQLRALEVEAAAAGLDMTDGSIRRSWGITGVADASHESDGDRLRARLQERVHQTVTTMGRHRVRLATECDRASRLLTEAGAALRLS